MKTQPLGWGAGSRGGSSHRGGIGILAAGHPPSATRAVLGFAMAVDLSASLFGVAVICKMQ